MRIIHDVEGDTQTACSGAAYAFRVDQPPPAWPGMRVSMMATWTDPGTEQEEAIHVEGDLDKIRAMLESWLQQLTTIEQDERRRHTEEVTGLVQCDACRCWARIGERHADGKGGTCDGAVARPP